MVLQILPPLTVELLLGYPASNASNCLNVGPLPDGAKVYLQGSNNPGNTAVDSNLLVVKLGLVETYLLVPMLAVSQAIIQVRSLHQVVHQILQNVRSLYIQVLLPVPMYLEHLKPLLLAVVIFGV